MTKAGTYFLIALCMGVWWAGVFFVATLLGLPPKYIPIAFVVGIFGTLWALCIGASGSTR